MTKAEAAGEELRKWTSQIRKGSLEMCLLGTIGTRPRYGFEIAQALQQAGELSVSEGTLYPLLNRLQGDGLIEASWRESASGPPRKYYALTPVGTAMLARMRVEWRKYTEAVERILEASEAGSAESPGGPLDVAPRGAS